MTKKLVLSLFPGIDLLGRGFELEGFCVVRGPDLLWGHDVRSFVPASHTFEGIIGGSPCQDFSKLRRIASTGYGVEMLAEFTRCVTEAGPQWFLLENVPGVPTIQVPGYSVQRFNLSARECGVPQNRLRTFQFGSRDAAGLVLRRVVTACTPSGFPAFSKAGESQCCLASEGRHKNRRSFADFCELMGLPRDFDLPGLSRAAKYAAVGNGVPIPMARVVATAVKLRSVTKKVRVCACDCGRPVSGRQTLATAACRKRMQRRRDTAGETVIPVTA